MKVRNTFIIFLVSGFWHGANWTFIIWGALNAFYFLPLLLSNRNRNNLDGIVGNGNFFPSFRDFLSVVGTFILTVFAWIFFRAKNVSHAFNYIGDIFSESLFSIPKVLPTKILILVLIFILIEWIGRQGEFALSKLDSFNKPIRWVIYLIIIVAIFAFTGSNQEFIYFQF